MVTKRNHDDPLKILLIIGDGMADYPIVALGNKTPLQVAYKPNMDSIAANGRNGLLKTVPDETLPGSDTAILSVLGYDPRLFCPARGALEAAARGIQLGEHDAVFRCNLITEKNGRIVDYSAGHITTREAKQLIKAVKEAFENPNEIEFFTGLDYRHFLVLRNLPNTSGIVCFPPHDFVGAEISTIMPKAESPEMENAAALLRSTILKSRSVLESHPINVSRQKAGKNFGNMIWPWGGGGKPSLPSFQERYDLRAAVISAVDLVKGIGVYTGMKVINVVGATGLYNTNYEAKAEAALKALEDNDLVFVHVEAPDEAGHERDYAKKVKTIEDLDKRLVGKLLTSIKIQCVIAVLPDHSTPISIGTHARDPVPFAIQTPFLVPDRVKKFDELSAKNGAFGLIEDESLMSLLLISAKRR